MIKTILLLIFTLIIVPLVAYFTGEPVVGEQYRILLNVIYIYAITAGATFILAEATNNCSQVDKIWSIMPFIYAWYITIEAGMEPRMVLMAVLASIWGLRLTYNFARRGGYSWKFWTGEEDYRWEVLKQNPALKGKVRWTLFNLFFISYYQLGLIMLFSLPILMAMPSNGGAENLIWADYLLAATMIGLVIMETVADQQQWNYQTEKYRRIKAGENLDGMYAKGFVHSGLWKWMRHPNYAAEQTIWVVYYLFSVVATGQWINWSVAGCLLLIILFKGSADFSENISAQKYPEYNEYIKKTGRFIPKFW